MKAAKGWDEGEEGNLLEKVSLFPLELPHHPCQNFLSRSMGLCRCAAGSRPAPVPRCCGGTVRMEVRVLPASSCPGGASSVSRQDSGKRFLKLHGQQRRKGPGSRRRQARTSFFSCRSVTDISPAQPTGWTNPALWSVTNQENFCFLRAGSCGRRRRPLGAKGRDGQICRTAAARGRWLVQRAEGKDGAEGGEPGLSRRERTAVVSADRQECRTGPRCRRCLPRWACAGRTYAGRRRSGRVCGSEATRSIGMSRAEGHVCF